MSADERRIIGVLLRRLGSSPMAITRAELDGTPEVDLKWNSATDRVRVTLVYGPAIDLDTLKVGDVVRVWCGAPARYVGLHAGKHLAAFVSAQDNDLGLDEVDPDRAPFTESGLPLPSDDTIEGLHRGLRYGGGRS